MAGKEPQDLYGTFGSVPDTEPQGGGGQAMGVRASPDAFGGAIASSLEGAGKKGEEVGSEMNQTAIKLQGMVNETTATTAESQYLAARGKLDGEFKSLSGQAAYLALPKYASDIQALRAQYRPGGADAVGGPSRAYDMTTIRAEGYSLNDANMWAASQVKTANRDAMLAGVNAYQMIAGQPGAAQNDQQFDEALGHITHFTQSTLHEGDPGVVPDGNGGFKFGDDEAGQTAKKGYQAALDANVGKAWSDRINTLAQTDPVAASAKYVDNKARIPVAAQAQIEANLRPQIIGAFMQGGVKDTLARAFAGHQDLYSSQYEAEHSPFTAAELKANPSLAGQPVNRDGRVTDVADAIHGQESGGRANSRTSIDGAVGGWQIKPDTFAQYAKPGEVITNPKDNDAVGRRIIADYSGKYKNADGSVDAQRVAVAYFSGPGNVSPPGSDKPYLADKADGNGKLVSSYVSDVSDRMGQKRPATPVSGLSGNFPKNADGSPISLPDYYASHKDEILANTDAYAERTMPGDIEFRNGLRSRVTNQMEAAISAQAATYKQDNTEIQRGIIGELSNGKAPKTWDELYAIPGMSALLNRSAVHSPQFYASIETQISRYNKQGKDTLDYGNKWDEVKNGIFDKRINSVADLAPYIHDNTLSAKGVDEAMKWMNDVEKKPVETETKKLAFETMKSVVWPNWKLDIGETGLAKWTRAQALLDPAWDQVQKDIADHKYTLDDALNRDSPHWWGKRIPPQFIPTDSEATAQTLGSVAQTGQFRTDVEAMLAYDKESDPKKKSAILKEMQDKKWISE